MVLLLVVVSMLAAVACIPGQLIVSATAPQPLVTPGTRASVVATALGGTKPYSFEWSQTGGEAVELDDPTSSTPTFLVPDVETGFTFTVTVTDAVGAEATSSVSLWTDVREPLVLTTTGPEGPVEAGRTVTLGLSLTGGEAPYRLGWLQQSGPSVSLDRTEGDTTSFTMPVEGGDVTILAIGIDARGVPATKPVVVAAEVIDPLVAAVGGPTDAVPAGRPVQLTSTVTGGREPYTYAWTQTAGPAVELDDVAGAAPTFTMPAGAGELAFSLTVTDARGTTAGATVTVAGTPSACGPTYQAIWDAARGGSLLPADLGPLGRATDGTVTAGATCDPVTGIAVDGLDVELLAGTITGSDLHGTITGGGLCLDGGSLVVRSELGAVTVALDGVNGLCLPIGELLAAADTVDAAGFPSIGGFTADLGTGALTVDGTGAHLVADGTPSVGGTAHAELDLALDGSVSGSAELRQVPVFGTPLDLTGTVAAPAAGALTGLLTATLAGPVEVVDGLDLADVEVSLAATGLAVSGEARLAAPVDATISFTGAVTGTDEWSLDLAADGEIGISEQIRLGDDLRLQVASVNGTVTGSGHATVVLTLDGSSQTVVADVALRADGTIVVAATVDLAEWDLGTGSGHVWFATDAVGGFDTGVPALGTIDLPAGLTAGIAWDIPAEAATALRDVVGLQLTGPTITVVASIDSEDGFTATVEVPIDPEHELVQGVPGGVQFGAATLTITDEQVEVVLDGTAGDGGTATGNLVVRADGSVTADLELTQVQVFGQPLDFTGELSAPAGGALTGSLRASLPGPIEVADGVELSDLVVSLGGDAALTFDGTATVAGFTVDVSGAYTDADDWTLTITSGTAGGTEVLDGLEVSGDLSGTVTSVAALVTFDVVAGDGATPVASWDLGSGHRADLSQVRVTNTVVPAECALPVEPGATWLRATGGLTLSNPAGDPVEVPMAACIDTVTGAFRITGEADGPIRISDQVSLGDDLALQIEGDGDGSLTGTGHATVVVTVDGTDQTVVADLALHDGGTLVIAATVDLAEWGLGEGTGTVWFATDDVADFETGNPDFGAIDLAAGLTAGISVTIPRSAYDALTNVVGLDLASPTVVLVASIGLDGSFSATMTVPTREESQIADGVPGGVRLGTATLHLTSTGFTVDVSGTAGDDGTVAVHLGVQADGAIDGTIDLHRIAVLGQPLDLEGTLVAPAAGNLVVTVTADLAGPIEVADGFVLSNLHVRLDPAGTFVSGDARIGGEAGPPVQVEGTITSDADWAVEVSSEATSWTPVSGLTLHATLDGHLRSTGGVITFDLTAGNADGPLATWDLGGGNGATLTLARVANVAAPATCTVATAPGDIWVSADGSLDLGTAGGTSVNLPIKACIDATSGAFAIGARSAQPIPLGRQVRLAEDLTLDLRSDGAGSMTGTGHATVQFTVDGTPQSVVADLTLRADGTLVIAARADLSAWGLGDGNGYVWFATGAVPGFATGDAEIGTIDLAAGLTIGLGVTIPESAFDALTGPLGLDLSSPTIVAVGSLGLDGELSATATVRTKAGHELVGGVPGGLRFEGAVLTVTDDGVGVSFDGTAGNGGTASADLTVGTDGSVSGNLELRQLPIFGHPVDLVGEVSAPVGGELTGSLTADVPGPVQVASGVSLHDVHLGLDASGLVVSADAAFGSAGGSRLHVEGSVVDDRTWSLAIDSSAAAWTIVPGLTVGSGLTGSITSVDGVVTFDAVAGTGATPVADWDLGNGNGVALTTVRAANTPVSATCAVTVPAGDVWIEASGRIAIGGANPIELPVHACVNAATGAFSIDAGITGAIAVTDQVRIADDLALTISGDGAGTITGTGHATVELTVEGDTQTVDADLALRGDGTLIVGATVDLAEWDLGEGTAHAWFASKAAAGFDTGDALGTLDLPAGLTVAVSYTIPESAYRALTETLGLDLADPTLTVVASVTTGGTFEAVATVQTKPDHELLPGVPGGLRLGTAQVTFRDDAVVVDLDGRAGSGTAEAHLTVTTDGAVSGTLDLRQVPVFGHPLDLAGSIDAPAGGELTGALTAGLPGPIVVSDVVTLFNLAVTLDETGFAAQGGARIGGPDGPVVQVDGRFADADNWSFDVRTDTQRSWTILPGVVVNADLTGTVSSSAGLVTFDVVAGAGSSGTTDAFAAWDLGNGSSVELTSVRVSNTVAPASCGAEVGTGDVWVAADGRLSLAADGGALDIPVHTCVDVTTGAFLITAATEAAIPLGDAVRLEPGLALAIRRDGDGAVVGAGEGTVTFTVDGTPQSVDATLSLESDGTFIIGAAIDLAAWGMGQGQGQAWFATGEVADFDTGDPALGTIDLPAGVTVGISFEMPDALYGVLTGDLGLSVPSRTIAVVASVTADGSFRATASLVGDEEATAGVLEGIPGGIRIGRAGVVFTDEGVTVDADGETGDGGAVTLHLDVRNDGSMEGRVELVDVSFFGTTIDLEGEVHAPAGGPLTGSLVADVPGPIWVSEHVELSEVHVAYDPSGLQVSATAKLGEHWGSEDEVDDRLVVTVDGTYLDTANWSLTVTSTAGTAYDVTPDLRIKATFLGAVTSVDGDVRFDLTAGNGDEPLVDWDLNGNHVILETARVSNETMSETCGLAGEWYQWEGNPWIEADGRLTIGLPGADPVDAPVHVCVDVRTGAFLVQAHTEDPIAIGDEVAIDPGMTLNLKGEPVFEPAPGEWDQEVTGWGSATATFTVNGRPQSVTVEVVVDAQGRLVVTGAIDLAEWGLGDGVGQVWYASADIGDHDGGETWGSIPLAEGLTVAVSIPIPAAASDVLQWDMGLPVPYGTLTAVGQVGDDGSFAATIRLRDVDLGNLLRTPGGATLVEAVLQVTSDGVVLDGHGTIGDTLGTGAGTFSMHLDVTSEGVLTGSIELVDLRVLDHVLDFSAAVDNQQGSFHFRAEATLPNPIEIAGGAFSVSDVRVAMDNQMGFELSAAVRVPLEDGQAVEGRLDGFVADDDNWYLDGTLDLPAWTPFPELTIDADVEASIGVYEGSPEFQLIVRDVVQWQPNAKTTVNFNQLTISNAPSYYWACNDVVDDGHLWMHGRATAHLELQQATWFSIGAEGCFDLDDADLVLSLEKTDPYPWDLGAVDLFEVGLELRHDGDTGVLTFGGHALGWIILDGRIVVATIRVELDSNGDVVLSASADLSDVVDARADAHVYYSSRPRIGFDTGDPEYGVIDLPQGVSVFVRIALPQHIADTLKEDLDVDLSGMELHASASVSNGGAFRLQVEVRLPGDGIELFRTSDDPAKATWLRLQRLNVYVDTVFTRRVEVSAGGMLHFPAMTGSSASDLPVEASLSVGIDSGDIALGVSTQGAIWHDAFGIRGLNLSSFGVSGGIAGGWPQLGATATVVNLPADWAASLGYQQGQPITLALNISLTNPMLVLELGRPGSTTPVLLPGSRSGNPDAYRVNHAKLHIVPFATTIGGIDFPAGISLALDGTVKGRPMKIEAAFDPQTQRLYGEAVVPELRFGNALVIRNLYVKLDSKQDGLTFELRGAATFGPVNVIADINIGPAVPKIDIEVVDEIPGIVGDLEVTGTIKPNGGLTGTGETQMKVGNVLEDATVDLTDDGLLIKVPDFNGWEATATVSMSGLDLHLRKGIETPPYELGAFEVGGGAALDLHVVVTGGGWYVSGLAHVYVFAASVIDGWKRHQVDIWGVGFKIGSDEICVKHPQVPWPICLPIGSNPIDQGEFLVPQTVVVDEAGESTVVPSLAPEGADGRAFVIVPASAVGRSADGGLLLEGEPVDASTVAVLADAEYEALVGG